MQYRIVSDSSSNLFSLPGVSYSAVPLKIITQQKEYVDDASLDTEQMVEELRHVKGATSTSCPNMQEWLDAFEDAQCVFAVSITSSLSGSCSAAMQARDEYLALHPDARVHVIDTLSTGPEMVLIIEKIVDCIGKGMDFDAIVDTVQNYMKRTHLLFSLQSLINLARNGRVNAAAAALAGVLGIRVVGKASDEGTLQPLHKCRGEKRMLEALLNEIKATGFAGGKVRIAHCLNELSARVLRDMILSVFPTSDVSIAPCGGLCCYYAEKGGLIVGYESN